MWTEQRYRERNRESSKILRPFPQFPKSKESQPKVREITKTISARKTLNKAPQRCCMYPTHRQRKWERAVTEAHNVMTHAQVVAIKLKGEEHTIFLSMFGSIWSYLHTLSVRPQTTSSKLQLWHDVTPLEKWQKSTNMNKQGLLPASSSTTAWACRNSKTILTR